MPCRLSITEDRLTFWDNNQNWNYSITTLTSFTRTNYLYNNQLSPWLLVRNLNHQSSALCDENELLWLHNILDMQSTSNYKHNDIIRKSINTISTKNILKRYNHANITNYICGTEVTISINNDYCNHADMYLFFLILSRYWQDQCAINSFIETRVVDSNDTCIYVFNDCNGKRGLV